MNSKWTRVGDKVEITINKKELSMDKYKKITDLGIEIHIGLHPIKVMADADSLLKVLDAGVEVNGGMYEGRGQSGQYEDKGWGFDQSPANELTTHTGLVIGIKELKPKQVTITRADLDKAWKKVREGSCIDLNEIAKELGL